LLQEKYQLHERIELLGEVAHSKVKLGVVVVVVVVETRVVVVVSTI